MLNRLWAQDFITVRQIQSIINPRYFFVPPFTPPPSTHTYTDGATSAKSLRGSSGGAMRKYNSCIRTYLRVEEYFPTTLHYLNTQLIDAQWRASKFRYGWLAIHFGERADLAPTHATIALAGTPSLNLFALTFVAQTMHTVSMGGEDDAKDFFRLKNRFSTINNPFKNLIAIMDEIPRPWVN